MFVDESFFATLYRHPGVPEGVPWPEQQEFITPRGAVNWWSPENKTPCHGYWFRGLCVLSLADLSWMFGSELKNILHLRRRLILSMAKNLLVFGVRVRVRNLREI